MSTEFLVQVSLPNRKKQQFTLSGFSDLKSALSEKLLLVYPDAIDVQFVENVPSGIAKGGKTFKTAVMFQVRERLFMYGLISIS